MKILRLELFGFKSFVNRTIVSFDQPITAIVGSNGCGKSNVVDALYWVMGDMSPKHLRGSQMTDVIFSGSKDHAALDMAEVNLVMEMNPAVDPELPAQFKNANEVQITRRYYRSGESEYFINKNQCRLRDIQEFFMDTGMGAKSYSIIEQGAITRMVQQKPEERRRVIEDVAGILKFKARKAETLRKMENSRGNLNRIDDILKDLQKQLNSLKRQSDKAEKYRRFSEELKDLEISVAAQDWLNRGKEKGEDKGKIEELSAKRESVVEKLTEAKAGLEKLYEELHSIEPDLQEAREKSRQAELEFKDIQAKIHALDTRQDSQQERIQADQLAIEEIEARTQHLEKEIQMIVEKLEDKNSRLEELSQKSQELRSEHESIEARVQEARDNMQSTRQEMHAKEIEQTRITQETQNLQKQLASLQKKDEALTLQLDNLQSELEIAEAEKSSTMGHLEKAFSERSDLEENKKQVEESINTLDSRRHELLEKRNTVKEELAVVKSQKAQLEALETQLEGLESATRSIAMKLREEGKDKTLLADHIQVPELLEQAIESSLGRNVQRVKVESLANSEELRQKLSHTDDKEARSGRASFWIESIAKKQKRLRTPLDAIFVSNNPPPTPDEMDAPDPALSESDQSFRPSFFSSGGLETVQEEPNKFELVSPPSLKSVKEILLENSDVLGPLEDLVLNENEINATWAHLLQDVWVVRDREALYRLLEELEELPIDLVTLDGDLLTREGFLDFAPIEVSTEAAQAGLVQRKRVIHQLTERENQLVEELDRVQNELDGCVHRLTESKENFRQLTAKLSALNPDVERHSTFLREVEARIARLCEKRDLHNESQRLGKEAIEESSQELTSKTQEISKVEFERSQLQTAMESSESRLNTILEELKSHKVLLEEAEAEQKALDRSVAELNSQRSAYQQELELSQARREQSLKEIEKLHEEIRRIGGDRKLLDEKLEQQNRLHEELASQEVELTGTVEKQRLKTRESQREVDQHALEIQDIAAQLKDLEQKLAVNEVELKNVNEKLKDQYHLDLETMEDEKLQDLAQPTNLESLADPKAARERAHKLRDKIDRLGKINMVAIEEFEDLSQRHEYLFIQRQDVFDGLKQLEDAIERIDGESRQRFADAFKLVNEAFTNTFPILFGGGQAELRLTNPDDLLETGVEIVAQPPGKKLQSVSLLSGGEKALTAVSLIFGIFSIKPSPFCVLDEVDAPLDDTNVGRFNKQVRNMSLGSQIIMITHNKNTMESADALFGVTMERPGISKLASARLGELRS